MCGSNVPATDHVSTNDFGKVFSAKMLREGADFEAFRKQYFFASGTVTC